MSINFQFLLREEQMVYAILVRPCCNTAERGLGLTGVKLLIQKNVHKRI